MAIETKEKRIIEKVEKERSEFKKLIIQNPNYFGTFPEVQIKPVLPMKANTKYEELRCIGFYPERDLLKAVIDVKLSYGYKGDLCSSGSFEYVRFFVDWDGDGDFTDPDEDVGIASVNAHDIPDGEKVCLDKTKPFSYALTVKIDSKKRSCKNPYMVKVRAILSWDAPPDAGNPNYSPVWGNVVEKWIRIKARDYFLKDIVKVADLDALKIEPTMLELDIPVSKKKELGIAELKEIYKDRDVPEHRFNIAEIKKIAESVKLDPNLMVKYKLDPKFSQLVENINLILAEKPNTKYEELHCVGLNYDLDTLVATLTVKLPYGYSGDLCTKGSYEYVGFWAYVWDQIEQMCHWKYLGTSSVNVHDINKIPPDGLQYAVFLPVDLSGYKDKCSKPKIIKIRAILSWQSPPPPNHPDHNPVWGNKVDALIQIKPGTSPDGKQIPFISVAGGMAIESISGNTHTVLASSIGDGYANGPSVYGGYKAIESPFGGVIAICGHISNPPNDPPADSDKLEYKVQYRKSGAGWQDVTNDFRIWISTWNGISWSMSHKDQTAPTGYYLYEEDLTPPVQRFVEGDVLAQWHTPVYEGDGLYEIRVLLYMPGAAPAPDVPADHVSSNVVKVMIDNKVPDAAVSLDLGPCTKYEAGDTITGKFTAFDKHIYYYTLTVEPSVANPPVIDHPGETYPGGETATGLPALPASHLNGRVNEAFTLTTTKTTTPCGYVLHLGVWDRTIKDNHMPGNWNGATVGLCLLEEK
jgi:hypothetical protein